MKYCTQCGAPLPDNAAFCGQCGTPVPKEAPTPTFCTSCGAQLPPSAAVCPDCGAPVAPRVPQPSPAKASAASAVSAGRKKSLKAPLIIGIAAVLVVAVVVGGIFLAKALAGPSPKDFLKYQTQLLESRLPADGKAPDLADMAVDTDITISASADNPEVSTYLNGSSIGLKLKADEDATLVNALVTLMGSNVINATVTYDDGMLGLYLPELDANYYVCELDMFLERMLPLLEEAGIINGDQLRALLSDEGVDLAALAAELEESLDPKELQKLADPYLDILRSFFKEERITVEKNVTVPMSMTGDSLEKATVYTFAPQAEDIEQALTALAGQLEKDEKLHDFLLDLVNSNETIHELVAEMLWDIAGVDIATLDGLITSGQAQLAAELRQSIPEIVEEYRQSITAKWTLAVAGKTVRRISIELTNRYFNEAIGIGYEMAEQDGTRTEALFSTDEYGVTPLARLTSSQNGDMSNYDLFIYMDDTDSTMDLSCSMNTKKSSPLGCAYGTYSMTINDYGDSLNIGLNVQDGANGGTDHILSLSGSEYVSRYIFDDMFSRLSLTVNATDKSSAVKPSQSPVDITNYSLDQIGAILSRMGDSLENVFFSILYSYAW